MKIALKILIVTVLFCAGNLIAPQQTQAQVTFQVFYDGLSPYGNWVENPNYGYVWIPNAGADFMPYGTAGHWVLTDDGWTWVSDYPWGWAPFHYGRWYYDSVYGWEWIPDTVWGPAWVCWRTGGGCYGWTPLGWGVSVGVAFNAPPERWIFCNQEHICDPHVSSYYLPRTNYGNIYRSTTIINVTHRDAERAASYNYGPDRSEVERVTHTTVNPVQIRESSRPGSSVSGGALSIYRPTVTKTAPGGAKPAPAHVASIKDVKPLAQRPAHTSPLPNASRPQHTTTQSHTNVPMTKPNTSATHTTGTPATRPTSSSHTSKPVSRPTTTEPAKQYPSPYTVHPTKVPPAAQPQRSAPTQHTTSTPQRSVPVQQHTTAPQRTSQPQRAAPAGQPNKRKPG